jgi:sec-independent protein translocase protein TatA
MSPGLAGENAFWERISMIGGLGAQELLIVFVIALVLFGGKRLPEVGQSLGKALRNFKSAEEEVRKELDDAVKDTPDTKDPPEGPSKGEENGKEPADKNEASG